MIEKIFKAIWADVAVIVAFVAISCYYFITPIQENLTIGGDNDNTAAVGTSSELDEYIQKHDGERSRWTTTAFSGMPTYQISPSYNSSDNLVTFKSIYSLGLPTYATYVFMFLLGFYIMLRCFDFRAWMAALGAIVWAFSSYYFIIIGAGHIWKVYTLCFIPPTIAGMLLSYRGKYGWGIAVTGLFAALQIQSNHVQMSYYFLFVMGFIALAFFIDAIRQKKMAQWVKATACCIVGGLLGVAINISNLYHTWEYTKESMRGKTELTEVHKDAADQTSSGLERSYITHYSYQIGETWTLLIPNAKGGASVPLCTSEAAMKKANPQYEYIYQQGVFHQYFGGEEGTSGPVYVGAFVMFLAVLLLLVAPKKPLTWCLFAATMLSIMLAWGRYFMWFTDLFLDYVPMYAKFRTVESILVIAEFTLPFMALLALKEVVDNPACIQGDKGNIKLGVSFACTAGVCLLFWMMPNLFFDFSSPLDDRFAEMLGNSGFPMGDVHSMLHNVQEMRIALFRADCLRSFFIIAIGVAVMFVWRTGKLSATPMIAILTLLCLVDMWTVNKRYLNDDMFSQSSNVPRTIPMKPADREILQDKTPDYRVLDFTPANGTFNSNSTSYYHKSIGGYHAAKLRRYQELIDKYISREMGAIDQMHRQGYSVELFSDQYLPVLNMLNMRYIIHRDKTAEFNPGANGYAWFVDNLQYVNNADEELNGLESHNLKHEAVADAKFKSVLGEATLTADSTATVTLTDSEANRMEYDIQSQKGGVVVFSEVYYPGWQCTVDGTPVELGRANYILRALRVEGGKHHVVMVFDPQSLHTTESIAYAALTILLLIFAGTLARTYYTSRKKE